MTDNKAPLDSELAILKMQLKTAHEHERQLAEQHDAARRVTAALEHVLNAKVYGVEVGSIVEELNFCDDIPTGKFYQVTRIRSGFGNRKPSLDGKRLKRDGTPSARETYIGGHWRLGAGGSYRGILAR